MEANGTHKGYDMAPTKQFAIKCAIDIRNAPPAAYRLPTDGRQWTHLCVQRRMMAMELATYADPDGSNIYVGAKTLAAHNGIRDSATMERTPPGASKRARVARKWIIGLIRMEQRLRLVNGTFSVETQPEKGTTVHASVPLRSASVMRAAG